MDPSNLVDRFVALQQVAPILFALFTLFALAAVFVLGVLWAHGKWILPLHEKGKTDK